MENKNIKSIILVLVLFIGIFIGGFFVYFYVQQNPVPSKSIALNPTTTRTTVTNSASPTATLTTTPTISTTPTIAVCQTASTSGCTYTSTILGITFKYPLGWKVNESSIPNFIYPCNTITDYLNGKACSGDLQSPSLLIVPSTSQDAKEGIYISGPDEQYVMGGCTSCFQMQSNITINGKLFTLTYAPYLTSGITTYADKNTAGLQMPVGTGSKWGKVNINFEAIDSHESPIVLGVLKSITY